MIRSGQSITVLFTTRAFATGAATDATGTPTGTLYVNGTADAATVTVTNITTGVYKAAVTLPTLAVNDVATLRINATVAGVTDNAVIWTDIKGVFAGAVPDAVAGGSGGLMISGTNSGTTTLGALTVSGATTFTGAVVGSNAGNDLRINGVAPGAAGGLMIAGSNAAVTIDALTVTNATTLTGAVSLGSTLGVSGAITLASVAVSGALTVSGTATLLLSASSLARFATVDTGAVPAGIVDGSVVDLAANDDDVASVQDILDGITADHGAGSYEQDTPAIAVAVRDVSNASPAANSLGEAVNDAAAAGGTTAEEVWEYAERTLTTVAGSGAWYVTVTVTDGSDPLQGAIVRFTEDGNDSNTLSAATDAEGHAFFGLDALDWIATASKSGFSHTPETVTVADGSPIELTLTANSEIAAPVDPLFCTLYGDLIGGDGVRPEGVKVTIALVCSGPAYAGGDIIRTLFEPETDAAGHWEQQVARTDAIEPAGSLWHVTCPKARLNRKLAVEAGTLEVRALP